MSEINVEEIMEEIRKEIREKGITETIPPFSDYAKRANGDRTLEETIDYLKQNGQIIPYTATGTGIKKFIKKVIKKLVNIVVRPAIDQQNAINLELIHALAGLSELCEKQQKEIRLLKEQVGEKK